MEIFDVHHHVVTSYRDNDARWQEEFRTRVEVMEGNGIDMAVLLPSSGYAKAEGIKDTMRVNDAMVEYRQQDPKRFPVAFGTVEPDHGARALEEVDRIHALGLQGVCWHHFLSGAYIDSPVTQNFVRRMGELGLIPFVHINAENPLEAPWRLENLAREFPDITFVGLDGFSSHDQGQMVLSMLKHTPNILLDTALLKVPGFLREACETVGSQRILFGSNQYSMPVMYRQSPRPRWSDVLELVRNAPIGEADRDNILGLNAKRLFNLVEARVS